MRTKAELMLLLVTLIWSGTFVIVKSTLEFVSPMVFVSIRFIVASIILYLIFRSKLLSIPGHTIKKGIILGFFLFLGFVTQTIGMQYTTATKSALITGTFVIFTPILQTIIERKIPKTGNIIGVVLVSIGLLFLSSGQGDFREVIHNLGKSFNFGDFLTLICAIFYALYIVYLDLISPSTEFIHIVWLQIIATAVLSLITLILFDILSIEKVKLMPNTQVVLAILYTAIPATLITTFLQTKYQKYTTPTRAAILFTSEPLLASILAYFILSELLGFYGLMGGVVIIIGVLISELFDKQK